MNSIAIIRIRGMIGVRKDLAETLYRLRLRRKYACVVLENPTQVQLGMLKKIKDYQVIDDTYNSNPLSLEQALKVLGNIKVKGRKIFVMGDMMELGEQGELFHRKLGRGAVEVCDVFIGVGKLTRASCREALNRGFERKNIFSCTSNTQARSILFEKIIPGPDDIVLVKGSRAMKMEEVFKI